MESPLPSPTVWRKPWFERIYKIGIIIKAIDGLLELIAGILILIAPRLLHMALGGLAAEFGERNTRPFQFIAEYIGHVDAQLLQGGVIFLALFLLFHGLIKIALVYCLLKKIEKAYPVVLVILIAFVGYELYVFITSLSIPIAFFMLLDCVIIWLVWNEYQELKTKAKNVIE